MMKINGQDVKESLFPPVGITLSGKREIFQKAFGIEGFSRINLYGLEGAIAETEAVKRLCEEDKRLPNSY